MRTNWELHLERWTGAGLLDAASASQIRTWEAGQEQPQRFRWPAMLALAFGVLMVGAGVLLFVSAHWDELGPAPRMAIVLLMVAVFHAGGAAAAGRFEGLSVALHAAGTVALGAGIALAGQIFQLNEHWPAAVLMWAVGAGAAWLLLRHWTQAALVAILVPYWLAGEWWVRVVDYRIHNAAPIAAGVCALSFTYLSAHESVKDGPLRKALAWLGGLTLLPATLWTAAGEQSAPSFGLSAIGWMVAGFVPLALAAAIRRERALWNLGAIVWTLALAAWSNGRGEHVPVYAWCALGAVGLAWWGVRESRVERINLGMAGFATTLLSFYFSNVMDKLDRSASLVILGLLFLGGGWLLERARRRLVAQIRTEAI